MKKGKIKLTATTVSQAEDGTITRTEQTIYTDWRPIEETWLKDRYKKKPARTHQVPASKRKSKAA